MSASRSRSYLGNRTPGAVSGSVARSAILRDELGGAAYVAARALHWYTFRTADVTLSGSDITTVTDRGSGAINLDGTGHAPLHTAASSNFNGHGTATCDGTAEYLISASNLSAAADNVYVFVVARIVAATSGDVLWAWDGHYYGMDATNIRMVDSGNRTIAPHNTSKFIFASVAEAKPSDSAAAAGDEGTGVWINGKQYMSRTTVMDLDGAENFTLGSTLAGGSPSNIEVAEAIIFTGEMSLMQFAGVHNYLSEKYAITI